MSETGDTVARAEESLRGAERGLEEIGRSICGVEGSATAFMYVNQAISKVQDAIHSCYLMRKD